MTPSDRGYQDHQPPPETEDEKRERINFRATFDPHGRGKPAPGQPTAQAEAIALTKSQVMTLSKHYGIDWPRMQEDLHEAITRAIIAEGAAAGSLKEVVDLQAELADAKINVGNLEAQLAEVNADLASAKEDLKEATAPHPIPVPISIVTAPIAINPLKVTNPLKESL